MSAEEYRRVIMELIEEHNDPWVKAAFYGDPKVAKIVEELYKRWEKAGFKGVALDYATLEELKLLASKAQRYGRMGSSDAMRSALGRK